MSPIQLPSNISANMIQYLAIGTAYVAFIASFGLKWINLKAKKEAEGASNV